MAEQTDILVHVESDEWYPVYFLYEGSGGVERGVSRREMAFIDAVFASFDLVQERLSKRLPVTDDDISHTADLFSMIDLACPCLDSSCTGCELSEGGSK